MRTIDTPRKYRKIAQAGPEANRRLVEHALAYPPKSKGCNSATKSSDLQLVHALKGIGNYKGQRTRMDDNRLMDVVQINGKCTRLYAL